MTGNGLLLACILFVLYDVKDTNLIGLKLVTQNRFLEGIGKDDVSLLGHDEELAVSQGDSMYYESDLH